MHFRNSTVLYHLEKICVKMEHEFKEEKAKNDLKRGKIFKTYPRKNVFKNG